MIKAVENALIYTELSRNAAVFAALLSDTDRDMQLWRPAPGKWCLLEIVCHLFDEEREDFRARVKHVLERPLDALSPIDPPGWVQSRKYTDQKFEQKLQAFLEERADSVAWLRSLSGEGWENTHMHPVFGPMSARLFLENWLAHDLLHIRQITALRYEWLRQNGKTDTGYAGKW